MRFAFSATGGISYHLIARRRFRTLWAPFRARVRAWLAPWLAETRSDVLIVFGPSAGWTLPLDLFVGFSRVVFVEPDPVARFLLQRRLPAAVRAEFVARADLLPWTSPKKGAFAAFLLQYPGAAVLFSNVLGQIPLIAKRIDLDTQGEFLSALSSHPWASYHDLFSGSSLGASSLAARDPSLVFNSGAVVDHETAWLSNVSSKLALWPLTEDKLHVIEFVSAKPRAM